MDKDKENFENKIDMAFKKIDFPLKVVLVVIFVISLLYNLVLTLQYASLRKEFKKEKSNYSTNLERAKKQYEDLYVENQAQQKQLTDLNLELAETLNNTVDLQTMLSQLINESVTLKGIKDELDRGIKKTNNQITVLQKTVNSMIDKKQKYLDSTQFEMLDQKGKLK